MRRARSLLSLLVLCGTLLPACLPRAGAEGLSSDEAAAIRGAVQTQLDAFASDDAQTAFDQAAASTRDMLRDPDLFLALVKQRYPAVYRNRMALFSEPELVEGHALVSVRLTDPDDLVWIAVYALDHDADGSWKIESCNLIKTSTISI